MPVRTPGWSSRASTASRGGAPVASARDTIHSNELGVRALDGVDVRRQAEAPRVRLELAAELTVADENPVDARALALDPRRGLEQVAIALHLDEPPDRGHDRRRRRHAERRAKGRGRRARREASEIDAV